MLRGKVSYLQDISVAHTGAQVIQPRRFKDLCISAEPRADTLQILEVWRLHKWDAVVSVHWRHGHKGTTMGDLMGRRIRKAGSERRQGSISSKTPTSLRIHAHTGKNTCIHREYNNACMSKHCPQRDLSGLAELACQMASYGHT